MLSKYDFKYVIKKILIGVGIILFMSFINSCEVNALEYPVEMKNATFYLASPTGQNTMVAPSNQLNSVYNQTNKNSYYSFRLPFEIRTSLDQDPQTTMLYQGQYLVEIYVYAGQGNQALDYCYQLNSNFENINMTTGNWVSNQIKSQCIDLYKTNYNSVYAYRLLYKFEYNGGTSGADAINELRFTINSSPNDYFYSTNTVDVIGVSMSNIYDYDPDMVSQFKMEKNSQISIEHSQTMINQNQTIINQNTQTNNILNDDNVNGANAEVDSLLQNSAFNDNSGIQSIINAPLNLINGLTNSCTPIQLTIPYIDTPLTIPCIKQELNEHVPIIVPILSTAINGFIIYRILIDIVHMIKSARNPDDDRIEVLDL